VNDIPGLFEEEGSIMNEVEESEGLLLPIAAEDDDGRQAVIRAAIDDLPEWRDKLSRLNAVTEDAVADGVWDASPYSHGIANGLIMAISIILGRDPILKHSPDLSYIGWTSGARMISEERDRQITAEGYTTEHDDDHDRGELARAAAAYTLQDEGMWPWMADGPNFKDDISNLTKAGALIAAEIDRLLRGGRA
jgi:hypothetical protein